VKDAKASYANGTAEVTYDPAKTAPDAIAKAITQKTGVAGRERQYRSERLLVATGRRPNTDHIAIDRSGVQMNERGEVVVDEHLQTNVPHIFAAGDVIGTQHGSQMATPVGSRQGGLAARNAPVAE